MKFENKKWEDVVYICHKVLALAHLVYYYAGFFSLSMYEGKILRLFAVTF